MYIKKNNTISKWVNCNDYTCRYIMYMETMNWAIQ